MRLHVHALGRQQPPGAAHDPHALLLEPAVHVLGLRDGEPAHPLVDPAEVDAQAAGRVRVAAAGEPHAQLVRAVDERHHLGGGDQGLGRDDVGEHGRAAEARPLDHGDVGAELRGHQRRLVAAGAAAHDDDAGAGTHLAGLVGRGRAGRGLRRGRRLVAHRDPL